MGGKSSPSPPPAPDPTVTASAQGASNVSTAAAQTALNNANVYTPYGQTTFQQTGSQTITQPDGSQQTLPTYSEYQNLSQDQQTLVDQNNALAIRGNDVASNALAQVGNTLQSPLTADQFGTIQTSVGGTPTLATGYDQGGQIQKSVDQQQAATTFGNTANAVQYFQPGDFNAARDSATNAALARLQPQMDQANASLQSQLANQGVSAGSSAYNDALLQQGQSNNDLRLGAVQTGDAEQQALFGQAAQANQLFNAAQQQDFGQQQARGQFQQAGTAANNASAIAAGSFANSAQGQQNAENQALAGFSNTAANQDYQNRLAGGAFTNSAIAQQLQQAMALQNQQINQISALRSGGQVTGVQSPSYSAGTLDQTPLSSDVYQTAALQNQQYAAQLQNSAANTAAFGSAIGGLAGGIGKKSDRRLKTDVTRIATARNGLPIYAYKMPGEAPGWHLGMMADEVALVHPDAVWTDPADGWARVDYDLAVA